MESGILSIDIGGTKIAGGIVDQQGIVRHYRSIPTDAQKGGEALMCRVIQFCQTMCEEIRKESSGSNIQLDLAAIGISSAGQIDNQSGKVIYASDNLPGWTGMEIKSHIETEINLPVFVENDVNCLALGEHRFGAGKGHNQILCMAIGTGIGGALILNGVLYRGWKGSAGELGHLCIDYQGRRCICGARGCLEAYVAGPAIEKDYLQRYEQNHPNILKPDLPQMHLEDIAQLAQLGDQDAQAVIITAGEYLGYGLYGLLNTFNPEIVIIGGGVVNVGKSFLEETRRIISISALEPMRQTPIVAAQLQGANAGLVGAAVFCWQELGGIFAR